MKTTVSIRESKIESSKNFESKIAKIVNDKLAEYGKESVESIVIYDVGMERRGKGQFKEVMNLVIDGFEYDITKHSTDSQTYDDLRDYDEINPTTYNNFIKRFTLSLLNNGAERLIDDILENREVSE